MLRNYWKVAVRNLLKNKFYSLLNIFGLAIGIACCILIFIYVNDELGFDRFHSKADRTYRLNEFILTEGSGERSSSLPFPTGPVMFEEFPNYIETQTRLFNFQSPTLALANLENEKEFNERRIFLVDSTFFDVFDFNLIRGDLATALDEPRSIILTESSARKYFDEENPIGKMLRFQGTQDLMVTGIVEDAPQNGHFQFDFLISISSVKDFFRGQLPQSWYWNPCWTYVVLHESSNPADLEMLLPDFIQKFFPDFIKDDVTMALQPLTDIHLKSNLEFEIQANSNEDNVYLFIVIAVFVLLIASINFMNLSTARSIKRAREVGMRKTLGSMKVQLIFQFIMESMLITMISILVSMVIVYLTIPWFNILTEKSIPLAAILSSEILSGLGIVVLLVGVGSGFYPALVLSSFNPIKVLKGNKIEGGGLNLRKLLVILQFTISIIMIIGTVIAIQQLDFLRKSDTGFNSEQVILVPVTRSSIANKFKTYKNEVKRHSGVLEVTALEEILGAKHQGGNYTFEGMDASKLFSRLTIRHDFLKTFGIEMIAGRPYSEDRIGEDTSSVIVNESMARKMGWTAEETIGKSFRGGRSRGEIIGVVKDFNFASKHNPISPIVLDLDTRPGAFNLFLKYMAVRVDADNFQETIGVLESTWKEMVPERPFEFFFLDDELNNLYKAEEKLGKVAGIFSGLTIFVACLGLLGLASFMAEQRKKEIGIRKVMGGSISEIVMLLSGGFSKLVLVSLILAGPIAWYSIDYWLQNFAYHIDINLWVFLLVGLGTLIFTLATISYQSIKAASMNPIDSLKYE